MTGTLGGGCVEAAVRRSAHQLLLRDHSEIVTCPLDHDFGYDDGMICGGTMELAVQTLSGPSDAEELHSALTELQRGNSTTLVLQAAHRGEVRAYRIHLEAAPKLLIAGAGHISRLLAPLASSLGFRVWVIDERSEYANGDRFPAPLCPVVGDIAGTLRAWPVDAATYVVIVTRGHKHDEAALKVVARSPAAYVGMIGSRRKVAVIFDDLRSAGVPDDLLQRVHAPIGLPIGAKTAMEIAVSIAAELTAVRRRATPAAVEGPLTPEAVS